MMQNEARQDQSNISQINQLEKQAALVGGEYSKRNQDNELLSWQQQKQGEEMRRADMMKYIMGGLSSVGSNVLAGNYAGVFDGMGGGGNGNPSFKTDGGMGTTPYDGGATQPQVQQPQYDNSLPLFDFMNNGGLGNIPTIFK